MAASMLALGLDKLTPDERIALAMELWASLGDDGPRAPSTEKRAELERRDAELDRDPEIALTWERIRTEVEGRP